MRVCLVVHGFPPVERTGVEQYSLGLCRALTRLGHRVEVFVPRKDPRTADLALRREERGGFAVNWITNNHAPESPRDALLVPELRTPFAAFLDRERPEVVHFQHLIKLGIGLVEAAKERGLPTLYTAHDYYPICHRYTLLRPDLTHCEARGDSLACARCDLALSHLNEHPELGDYHAGALPDQLAAGEWEKLEGILAGQLEEHGVAREAFAKLAEQRTELDRKRAEAYAGLDLVLAPSRYLIGELVRGGFEPGRVVHQPYGFETEDLRALPRVRAEPSRAVRFAFLGGLTKHKGVHVLLEAFARLAGRAELQIWGGSSDRVYVRALRERCSAVGAQFRGSYERPDLPRILRDVDALVVPSIWVENYPLVVHEGFAAGRPVLASRFGALAECVQDGVDGLLFAPGDAEDLARVMQRCVDEPALLPELARDIRPVKTMDEEARELSGRYERLLAERRAARKPTDPPASLQGALTRFEELSALPARELFARALGGLDHLRVAWKDDLGPVEAVELLAGGLGEGSEVQDRLREAKNEIAWLRNKKDEFEEGHDELSKLFVDLDRLLTDTREGTKQQAEQLAASGSYVRLKEAEVLAAHARMRELEAVIAEKNRYIGEVEEHLHEAGRYIRKKEQEYTDVEAELRKAADFARSKEDEARAAEAELRRAGEFARSKDTEAVTTAEFARAKEAEARTVGAEMEKTVEFARAKEAEARAAEAELREAAEIARVKEDELRAAQESRRVLERGTRSVAQVAGSAVELQERLLNRALRPILQELHALLDPTGKLELPAEGSHFIDLIRAMVQVQSALATLGDELRWRRPMKAELDWRRERMDKFLRAYEARKLLRLVLDRTPIGRKLQAWKADSWEETRP